MKIFSHYGIQDFVLCLGYKGWQIKEYFLYFKLMTHDFAVTLEDPNSITFYGGAEELKWKVTFAETGDDTMTGGRIWRIRRHLEGEKHFCLTYGDGLANVNIHQLIEHHQSSGMAGTITAVRPVSRFGEITAVGDSVVAFNEKPNVTGGWINGGFMVFDASRVWKYFTPADDLVLEKGPLPAMAHDQQLAIFRHEGFWVGMDTMREYQMLTEMWNLKRAPWKVWPDARASQ
jgi:glucose-1-phosphate cytidylyltransferase